jgi:hypothetical protein
VLVVVLPNIDALRSSGFTYPTQLPEVVDVTSHPFRAVTGVAKKGLSQPCGIQGENAIDLRNEFSLTMYPIVSAVAVTLTDVRLSVVVDLAIMRGRKHRLTTSASLCRYFLSPSSMATNREEKVGGTVARDDDEEGDSLGTKIRGSSPSTSAAMFASCIHELINCLRGA